jgi:hypothetical protein
MKKWDMEKGLEDQTEAATEAVLEEREVLGRVLVQEKCIKQHAQSVARNAKFRSSLLRANQSFAENASRKGNDSKLLHKKLMYHDFFILKLFFLFHKI